VNEDSHLETPAVDVDYALVVSGAKPPQVPPLAPTDLHGRAAGHVAWLQFHDESEDELAFELERSDDGLTFTPLATLAADDSEHFDGGLAPYTTYFYRVRATNAFGASAWSNVLRVGTNKGAEH
jgi:titin